LLQPDLVGMSQIHANDWHTALIPYYLKVFRGAKIQVKQMLGAPFGVRAIDKNNNSWHAYYIMWDNKRPIDDYNFYALLGIVQSGMWLQKDIEKYLSDFELSYGRFSLMLALLESVKNSGTELSKRLGVSKTTISKLIKRLIDDKFIIFTNNEIDKRVVYYELSKKGKEKLNQIIPGYLLRMRIIGSNISVDEKKQLISIINKINFIDDETVLSRFDERPLWDKAKEIELYCKNGSKEDIDNVMAFLDETSDIPLTRVVDFYLGTVKTIEGMKQIEHYLFNGTQMQRNYSTLFFARNNEWSLVNKAYKMGLIDYIQAYSK